MTQIEQFLIWRRRAGMSQTAAAASLGVGRSVVRRIECGVVSPLEFIPADQLPVLPSPGEELWLLRRRHALGLGEAAAMLDVSRTQLYLLERDRARIVGREIADIERAYRYSSELTL
jgi:DNA-binding XRE family transcriptional regulator